MQEHRKFRRFRNGEGFFWKLEQRSFNVYKPFVRRVRRKVISNFKKGFVSSWWFYHIDFYIKTDWSMFWKWRLSEWNWLSAFTEHVYPFLSLRSYTPMWLNISVEKWIATLDHNFLATCKSCPTCPWLIIPL